MTPESYLIAAFAVVLTGISKSGFAGGLGILGVPLVALTMAPQTAAVLLLPILIGIDILTVWRYRRAWRASVIVALLPGAAIGIALGMVGFARIDPDLLRVAIGLLAIGFAVRFMRGGPPPDPAGNRYRQGRILVASAVSGFAGFVAHAGGPPIKGTLLAMGLDKTAFVGTNAVFFLLLNTAKGFGYAALGLFSTGGLLASASLAPFLFLGVGIGFVLHRRISQGLFLRLAYLLLLIAGANLLFIGIASLLGRTG